MPLADKVTVAIRLVVANQHIGPRPDFTSIPTDAMEQLEIALNAHDAHRKELADTVKGQATQLRRGLRAMSTAFPTEICAVCKGEGEHDQRYTAGCGGGHFNLKDTCSCCGGKGLLQGGRPAPDSVLAQVLTAAEVNLCTILSG